MIKRVLLSIVAFVVLAPAVFALPPEAYAPSSVLASGKWVKIGVEQSGIHLITTAQLRSWGFADPARVRVYGYGGAMLPDELIPEQYIDDLPEVPAERNSRGVYFYAQGPISVSFSSKAAFSHLINPYSTKGYYFLTEGDNPAAPQRIDTGEQSGTGETRGYAMLLHERELTSPGGSGRMFVGEDFNLTRSRSFKFTMPKRLKGTQVVVDCSFVARSATADSRVAFTINGESMAATNSDRIMRLPTIEGTWGNQALTYKAVVPEGEQLDVTLDFIASGTILSANLDYLRVTYERELSGECDFYTPGTVLRHTDISSNPNFRLWDVTTAHSPVQINTTERGSWRNNSGAPAHYVVWDSNSTAYPTPTLEVASVANQNLHAMQEVPDMVIITPTIYKRASEEIANLHRTYAYDPLSVEVVELRDVLNEFGSGSFDPGAIRRFLKMLFDRGEAANTPLRFALLMGKGTSDNRALTSTGRSVDSPMPLWVSEESLAENRSFSTDDYFAFIEDYDGQSPSRESLDIAVGRIPCTSTAEADIAVAKIKRYMYSQPRDDWHNRLTILADDENDGDHLTQSEGMIENLTKTPMGSNFLVQKVYCDAYERINSTYPQARTELFDYFADGTSVFAFIGHGSPTALGSKNIIGPTDFRDKFHLRKLPFFYAATCSFLKWDYDLTSMAEVMMFQSDGGMIGCISALRPVFIVSNGRLSGAFGTQLGQLGRDGREQTIGEIYQGAKNQLFSDTNRLRYVLMGDPALRLAAPANRVELTAVNSTEVGTADEDEEIVLMARQDILLEGQITNSAGELLSDFNGTVTATLYDAEESVITNGYGEGRQLVFDRHGSKLFTASGKVADGRFTISARMPSEIAQNYRPATLSLYAAPAEDADLRGAMSVVRNLCAFGYDESAEADNEKPKIHSLVLNSDGFKSGDKVNESPLLLATLSDNEGINVSSAGVGRLMVVILDNTTTLTDVSRYFTPHPEPIEGKMSGTLSYPLTALTPGEHELKLRVWDVDNNFAEQTIKFNVVNGLKPEIFDVYTDANPARTSTNFYVRHNRPEALLTVKITVYNLMGIPLWSTTTQNRSTMDVTEPIEWNLTDLAGRRLPRGIYLYKAEIATDNETFSTSARKIAITAPL